MTTLLVDDALTGPASPEWGDGRSSDLVIPFAQPQAGKGEDYDDDAFFEDEDSDDDDFIEDEDEEDLFEDDDEEEDVFYDDDFDEDEDL